MHESINDPLLLLQYILYGGCSRVVNRSLPVMKSGHAEAGVWGVTHHTFARTVGNSIAFLEMHAL